MTRPAAIDHVVVNALFELDAACATFAALGFTVTPRGYHSLGSMNHLIMTPGGYLELVGVPREGLQRADVLSSPLGWSGLVFKSPDADATYAHVLSCGIEALAPLAFSRPVELDGQTHAARFRIVRLPSERFRAGRVYFCEHLTPELVWQPALNVHANGLQRIDRLEVESTDIARDTALYAAVASTQASVQSDGVVLPVEGLEIVMRPGPQDRFSSVDLCFDSLDGIAQRAQALPQVEWAPAGPGVALLRIPELQLQLRCVAGTP